MLVSSFSGVILSFQTIKSFSYKIGRNVGRGWLAAVAHRCVKGATVWGSTLALFLK